MALASGEELDHLGVREVLDQDSRPTFLIDLDPDENKASATNAILPVFSNQALRLHEKLFDALIGTDASGLHNTREKPTYEDFKNWANGVTKFDDSKDPFPLSFLYGEMLWTGCTVRQRWRLISGNLCWQSNAPPLDLSSGPPGEVSTGGLRVEQMSDRFSGSYTSPHKPSVAPTDVSKSTGMSTTLVEAPIREKKSKPAYLPKTSSSGDTGDSSASKMSISLSAPEKAVSDWTVDKPKGLLSPHMTFARTVDWSSTPLGAMKSWSPGFRQTVNLVFSNPHPAALFWGGDLTMLYNEAYGKEVAGNKHPFLMGTGFQGPFSELWDSVGPIFAECARTGISVRKESDYLPIERYGLLEETFFSWSFTPLYGGTNRILGFYNAPFETTQQVLSERRIKTVNRLGELVARAKTVKQYWEYIMEALEDNHFDVPFALLYSVGENDDADGSSISSGSTISLKSCHFEGSIGIPEGHIASPKQLDLKRSREGFIPSFREAMRTREPTSLHTRDGTLPEALLEGINWRGFGDPCNQAIIFPVRPTNGETVLAFLLLGINPRRPYDQGYQAFTSMLNRQMATSLASVLLFETEVKKSIEAAELAAMESERLTQQLAVQTSHLRRMTELSPLGMFLISPEGVLREANDRYFEMTGHPRDDMHEFSWMEHIAKSSKTTMENGWRQMVHEKLPWSGEIQHNKMSGQHPVDLDGAPIDYWVLTTAQPEIASDGSIRSIMGSITDISHLKWAQGLQNRRLQEAEETRRQQNEFIDITSHEMRNPLSAIIQCADDISTTLDEYCAKDTAPPIAVVENCIESANTITLCVQHQKAIVDDILTISKLDSNLMVITPVPAQPVSVAKRAVKMFDPELQAKNIKLVFNVHNSIKELGINWVCLDPSRILQILINLMTNAIKFTSTSEERVITVSLGASLNVPTVKTPNFHYIPTKNPTSSIPIGEDWGSGEVVYLRFKVKDTGCGLSEEEKQLLFKRFSQASPRTHAQYGGSGLGLFISRQLAELHSGQIGVASEAGSGSTFGFFITTRRADSPRGERPRETFPLEVLQSSSSLDRQLALQRQDVASTRPAASLLAMKATPNLDPKDLDILVVEDNLVNQKVLRKQLQKIGVSVAVANDGIEALAFLDTSHFRINGGVKLSVILMDWEMPNMDGLTCVREIRKMEEGGKISGHVPVIAVTANVRDEQVAAALHSGMDDVVSKPFRIPDLIKKIEVLLATLQRQRE